MRSKAGRRSVGLVAALLLGGCAQWGPRPDTLPPVAEQPLAHWTLTGKLGARSPEDSITLHCRWQQTGARYRIRLTAPFGGDTVRISGGPGAARLDWPDGRHLTANDATTLLADVLGVSAPVASLRYWVQGQADPAWPGRPRTGTDGLPHTLRQRGWTVHWSRFTAVGGHSLPGKVVADNGAGTRLTLLVRDWQLTATPGITAP